MKDPFNCNEVNFPIKTNLTTDKVVKAKATEADKADVRAKYAAGMTVTQIAKETGFAQSSISRWVGNWVPAKKQKNEPAAAGAVTSSDVKKSYEENPQINFNTNSAEKQAEKQIKAVINPVKAAVMLEGFLTDWLGDEAEAVGLCANAKWCDIRFKHSGQVYSLSFSFIEEEKTNG